jgi:hypothetical protein
MFMRVGPGMACDSWGIYAPAWVAYRGNQSGALH